MFYAVNRFTVDANRSDEFLKVWKERDSHLKEIEGYISFKMLKGRVKEDKVLFVSQTLWKDEESFAAWTPSEQFKKPHGKNKMPSGVILGPPAFEAYNIVLEEN